MEKESGIIFVKRQLKYLICTSLEGYFHIDENSFESKLSIETKNI